MRTLRLSLAGTVILVLLGWSGGPAVAQEDGAAFVTGTVDCRPTETLVRRVDAAVDLHQMEWRCTMEMSDDRVSGFTIILLQEACFKEAGHACVTAGTVELVPGPDGRWVGRWGSIPDVDRGPISCGEEFISGALQCDTTPTASPAWATLEGTGIYEGWTYWFHGLDPNESDAVSGIIFEGPPPPWKTSLPLEPAE